MQVETYKCDNCDKSTEIPNSTEGWIQFRSEECSCIKYSRGVDKQSNTPLVNEVMSDRDFCSFECFESYLKNLHKDLA